MGIALFNGTNGTKFNTHKSLYAVRNSCSIDYCSTVELNFNVVFQYVDTAYGRVIIAFTIILILSALLQFVYTAYKVDNIMQSQP